MIWGNDSLGRQRFITLGLKYCKGGRKTRRPCKRGVRKIFKHIKELGLDHKWEKNNSKCSLLSVTRLAVKCPKEIQPMYYENKIILEVVI